MVLLSTVNIHNSELCRNKGNESLPTRFCSPYIKKMRPFCGPYSDLFNFPLQLTQEEMPCAILSKPPMC